MKIYFAHPCFNEKQREFKKVFLQKLSVALSHKNDITVIDPFEYSPDIEGDVETKLKMAESIKTECLRLLEESDILIALTDDDDTGTALEIGYAHAFNKPVILISRDNCSAANAMLIGSSKMMVNNVLEDEQIRKLVEFINLFYVTWRVPRKSPENN